MSKTPLILIPGLLCDALLWAPQIGALSDIADCWVADSACAESVGQLASDLLRRSPFPEFAIAGLSMGGYIAMEVMRQAPHRVRKLALLDTNARADTPEQTARRLALMDLAKTGKFTDVPSTLLPALINRARSYDPQIVGTVFTMARNVGADAFLMQEAAIIGRADSRPSLGAIQCPCLVLCGRQDAMTPPSLHEEIAARIPRATLTVVEDCGHLSTIEQPEEVNLAMRRWITE